MALSRDRGTANQKVDQGYGLVCDIDGKSIDGLWVCGANQEHGIITARNREGFDPKKIPDRNTAENFTQPCLSDRRTTSLLLRSE